MTSGRVEIWARHALATAYGALGRRFALSLGVTALRDKSRAWWLAATRASNLTSHAGSRPQASLRSTPCRWPWYFALPILYGDRLVGKLDATADRKAGVLRVNAIHRDVANTLTMSAAVRREIRDLAHWLELDPTLPVSAL